MTNDLPDGQCHRKREHVPHVVYEGSTAVSYCRGVGNLFPTDRLTPPVDPFEGVDEAYDNSEW